MLKQIAEMTQDKLALLEDLDCKKRVIDAYGQIKKTFDNKSLFLAKFFRLYSDPDGGTVIQNVNKSYSLSDFKDMTPSDLENKVFVHSESFCTYKSFCTSGCFCVGNRFCVSRKFSTYLHVCLMR